MSLRRVLYVMDVPKTAQQRHVFTGNLLKIGSTRISDDTLYIVSKDHFFISTILLNNHDFS